MKIFFFGFENKTLCKSSFSLSFFSLIQIVMISEVGYGPVLLHGCCIMKFHGHDLTSRNVLWKWLLVTSFSPSALQQSLFGKISRAIRVLYTAYFLKTISRTNLYSFTKTQKFLFLILLVQSIFINFLQFQKKKRTILYNLHQSPPL